MMNPTQKHDQELIRRATPDGRLERIAALEAELAEARDEVARLRAEIESRFSVDEVASWLFEYRGSYREKTLRAWDAEKRAALRGAEK